MLQRLLWTLAIPLFMILLSVNCGGRGKEKILSEKQLIELLVDIHVADGIALDMNNKVDATYVLDSASLYQSIFNKHGVTRKQFDTSMVYYTARPKKFNEIYNQVLVEVKQLEEEVTRQMEAEKAPPPEDSL
jgi:hypothetical protein